MLEQAYVQKTKAVGARQRIEVVQFSTDTESVGKVVTARAEELQADMVVGFLSFLNISVFEKWARNSHACLYGSYVYLITGKSEPLAKCCSFQ